MHINFLVQNLINPQLTVIWFRFSTSLAFHHILQQAFLNTKFIYFNWRLITLQYCIVFAIYQHESAIGIHVFPINTLKSNFEHLQ